MRWFAGGLATAVTVTCFFVGTAGAGAASSTTGPDGYPIPPGGVINVVLKPAASSSTTNGAIPDAGPVINCSVDLSDLVHYSNPSDDISWHWTWSCDGDATLTGSQALFYNNYPATSGGYSSGPGFSGGVNARYALCKVGFWQGIMSGTFTALDYTPAFVEGSTRPNHVTC